MFRILFAVAAAHILSFNFNVECQKLNKYSAEANLGFKDKLPTVPFSKLGKPFRTAKMNRLWSKAQAHGLSEPKLKSLHGELTFHDGEELSFKQLKLDGKDKAGLVEAEVRKKLLRIMDRYGLSEHFEAISGGNKAVEDNVYNEATEEHLGKSLFKDKKLNKLWSAAETSGFSTLELEALREEFSHHQDKIDEYYSLLHDVKESPGDGDQHENSIDEKLEQFNTINAEEPNKKDYLHKVNMVRDKHRDLRDGFDRLNRLAAKGPSSKEFLEPKVQGLWRIALESNFGVEELESLRVELLHYENRLLKLRHLQAQAATNERHKEKTMHDKTDQVAMLEDSIKKQFRKVEKIHLDLETRIMQKHIEL